MITKDQYVKDSTLSYFINQLDNLDPTLYQPLVSITWGRDIKLRTGITMANESTSFTRSSFAGAGTQSATGKPWVNANGGGLVGVDINGERIVTPLNLLAQEISYTSVELERYQLLKQSIDRQKFDAFNTMYQMNIDEQVYVGDTDKAVKGLVNSTLVNTAAVANGASSSPLWINKTPDEILNDVNSMIQTAWAASAFAVCPDRLLLPPAQFAYITSQKVSTAGNVSILKFLEDNSISLKVNGRALDIQPLKWLTGRGASGTDRMVAYTNDENRLRFPMVPVRRETAYYQDIRFFAPYIWAMGSVEFVYPETVIYRDGI